MFSNNKIWKQVQKYLPEENRISETNIPSEKTVCFQDIEIRYDEYLPEVINDAKARGRDGLTAVVGTKKYHFMSDSKWLLKQGFKECDTTPAGFSLLYLSFNDQAALPQFNKQAKLGRCPENDGYVVYYTNRCPYTEYHVTESLTETAEKRKLDIKVITQVSQQLNRLFGLNCGGKLSIKSSRRAFITASDKTSTFLSVFFNS